MFIRPRSEMSKGITPADEYVFTLSKELEEMARTELRETKVLRDQSLQILRDWLENNPRIEAVRLDARFLLKFLRVKKFSIPIVQECIERYLLLRKSYGSLIFQNMSMDLPNINELLDLGYMFPLPQRDHAQRRVVFYRPGVFDLTKHTNYDMLKIHGMCNETFMENEEDQIRGLTHICDASGIGFGHLGLFTIREAIRIGKNAEKTVPMRHKEMHGFNINPSLKFAVDFGFTMTPEKLKNRVQIHTSLESAKTIDKSILPKEYGGTMPMKEMIELWKKELRAAQPSILRDDQMSVRLEMYSDLAREGAVRALHQPFDEHIMPDEFSSCGVQGSFRKLEVD